jgi:hypothetical protein
VIQTPAQAWVRLHSGRKLNILDPDPHSWDDADLAIGLSRTFRWGGYSQWPFPLPVAQHCLMVLVLTAQALGRRLTRTEYCRELLHDSDEALIGGYDAIRPLKAVLGDPFRDITNNLLQAAFTRYEVPYWTSAEYLIHKQADNLSAASEAIYVAGWTHAEIKDMLQIHLDPLTTDPLAEIYDCRPWEPWAPDIAAERFLEALKGQGRVIARYGVIDAQPTILFTPIVLLNELAHGAKQSLTQPGSFQCDLDCRWCIQEPITCNSQRKLG